MYNFKLILIMMHMSYLKTFRHNVQKINIMLWQPKILLLLLMNIHFIVSQIALSCHHILIQVVQMPEEIVNGLRIKVFVYQDKYLKQSLLERIIITLRITAVIVVGKYKLLFRLPALLEMFHQHVRILQDGDLQIICLVKGWLLRGIAQMDNF